MRAKSAKTSVLKKNIIANFGGNIWTGVMNLVFVPIYINLLGIESYGLIGIFASILSIVSILDMGLGITLNREMARLATIKDKSQEMRDLVRTLEIPYWLIGFFIGFIIVLISPYIANSWVKVEKLPIDSVQFAIIIMGIAIAFQWPLSFYSGGLMGLQQQVTLNLINSVMATIRGLGAILVLLFVAPTIEAFFLWQIIAYIFHTSLATFFLWYNLPKVTKAARFRYNLLKGIWRFAAGITGISILATLLTQLDKIILSRMLTLEMFGYYSLATVVAVSLYRVISPVFSAIYPQFTKIITLGAQHELLSLYHNSAQLVSVLTFSAAIVLSLFSKEILMLWIRNPVTVENTYLLVSILVIGTALNCIMNIPYALQLASGWTKLTFYVNLVSAIVIIPLIIVLTNLYGSVGAASVWVILNSGYLLINVQIMHTQLLPTEKWRWYREDVIKPLIIPLLLGFSFRLLIPFPSSIGLGLIYITAISAIILGTAALTTSVTRQWVCAIIGIKG